MEFSSKQVLVAAARGTVGMVPVAGPLLSEIVGLAADGGDDNGKKDDRPIWLVMGQSRGPEPVFWQIAVAADDAETAQGVAEDVAAEQGSALTQVDKVLEMKEDKALADPKSDFATLFLAAKVRGSAAIQLVGAGDEDT